MSTIVGLAFSAAGCAEAGRPAPTATSASASARAGRQIRAVAAEPQSVHLMQRDPTGKTRTLTVAPDGRWTCDGCAGDGRRTTGSLGQGQVQRLQKLVHDPAFGLENDSVRHYRMPCRDGLLSTLLVDVVTVSATDCAGDRATPVAGQILALLVDATPVTVTRTGPV